MKMAIKATITVPTLDLSSSDVSNPICITEMGIRAFLIKSLFGRKIIPSGLGVSLYGTSFIYSLRRDGKGLKQNNLGYLTRDFYSQSLKNLIVEENPRTDVQITDIFRSTVDYYSKYTINPTKRAPEMLLNLHSGDQLIFYADNTLCSMGIYYIAKILYDTNKTKIDIAHNDLRNTGDVARTVETFDNLHKEIANMVIVYDNLGQSAPATAENFRKIEFAKANNR